jgi:hypothetical protein
MKVIYYRKYKVDNEKGAQYIFRLFEFTCWVSTCHLEYGWFRIFGIGLHWKHKKRGLLFSERYGYSRYLQIGKWIIRYLPHR